MAAAVPGKVWGGVALALLLGCGGEETGGAASPPPARGTQTPARAPAAPQLSAAAEAAQIFTTRCVTCHGVKGAGDGPGSASLTPPPRNFQDPAWQAEVDDAHIANIIQFGGAAVGRSLTMPGNPDLTGKPEVVEALVVLIRNLKSE